jgi:DNA modification methylase
MPTEEYSSAIGVNTDSTFLEGWYAQLEEHFGVEVPQNGQLRYLCDAKQNLSVPVYSWFNLKEAFSSQFPVWVVEYLARNYDFQPKSVLDPFCGGGTTIIALSQRGIKAVGVEYNPFIASIAKAKSEWYAYDIDEITHTLEELEIDLPSGTRIRWPRLTTFHKRRYFRRDDVRTLIYALLQIEDLESSHHTKQFLCIGVAAAIEDVANLRKDGRALRYIRKTHRPSAKMALFNRWRQNLGDLEELRTKCDLAIGEESSVWMGSALDLRDLRDPWNNEGQGRLNDSSFDLVLYSPPYLNNFDYSEVYKLELWLLGFVNSYEGWKNLRLGTVRSHHSIKFENTAYLALDTGTAEIFENLESMRESPCLKGYAQANMPPVILGYFDDIYLAVKEQFRVLKPGGFLVYIVANSRHSDLSIATDVIIGEIARLLGFEPLKLIVLHRRNGRTRKQKYIRESVVILRKPCCSQGS